MMALVNAKKAFMEKNAKIIVIKIVKLVIQKMEHVINVLAAIILKKNLV